MTFRIPERGDRVRVLSIRFSLRPYAARVRRLATVADGQLAADLVVIMQHSGRAYSVDGVRYRDCDAGPESCRVCTGDFSMTDDEDAAV
jgi:hypothetical protein